MSEPMVVEVHREISYLWGYCRGLLPVIAISIAFTATIEIVFRFILLGRRRRKIEKMLEQKYGELAEKEEEVFWRFLRKKLK